MKSVFVALILVNAVFALLAQPWEEDNAVFNPSGIPSLTFSQPRFGDIDADGDMDIMLGSSAVAPIYLQNIGTPTAPAYTEGEDITAGISYLHAEMVSCVDLDADGDLDMVTGGYSGLCFFRNDGTVANPLYTYVPGFFPNVDCGSYPVPDLADTDSDGDLDMVLGFSESGAVLVYTNTGTASVAAFSQANSIQIADVGLYAYPVFCDFDGDGDQDILSGRDSQAFLYFQNNGTASVPMWVENSALFSGLGMGTYWNSGDLADLNGDGTYDLIYGTASGPLQYYVNTGTAAAPNWQINTSMFGGVIDVGGASSPCFYDYDNDGDLDMFSGSQLGNIKYYENTGTPYSPAWEEDSAFLASIDHSIYSAVAVQHVSVSFLPDIIVGDLSGQLYHHVNNGLGYVEGQGLVPNVSLGGWSVPRLVDWDNDMDFDLATGNEAGTMRFWENMDEVGDPSFVEVPGFFGNIDVGSNCSPTFGDVDEDGDLDILAGTMWGDLVCYLHGPLGWAQNTSLFAGISTDQNAAPALVDLDHDGDLDVVLGDYDGTFKFFRNLKYSGAVLNPPQNIQAQYLENVLVTWDAPQPGSTSPLHSYRIYVNGVFIHETGENYVWLISLPGVTYHVEVTANYIAGESEPISILVMVTPTDDAMAAPVSLRTWPNPFRSSVYIETEVGEPKSGTLRIYNIKGQIVKEWQISGSGKHQVIWDGLDNRGRRVASGTYICMMRTPSGTATRRMLLIRD